MYRAGPNYRSRVPPKKGREGVGGVEKENIKKLYNKNLFKSGNKYPGSSTSVK